MDLWLLVTPTGDAHRDDFSSLAGPNFGRQVDLYKEGDEQYINDVFRDNFKQYGFHLVIAPIFRNLSNLDLGRELERRSQAARTSASHGAPY